MRPRSPADRPRADADCRRAQPSTQSHKIEAITMFETHRTWTTERIALLKNLVDTGLSCGQIAREIGVSRNAVIGKINRLGLSRFKRTPGALPGRAATAKLVRPRLVSQRRILNA